MRAYEYRLCRFGIASKLDDKGRGQMSEVPQKTNDNIFITEEEAKKIIDLIHESEIEYGYDAELGKLIDKLEMLI